MLLDNLPFVLESLLRRTANRELAWTQNPKNVYEYTCELPNNETVARVSVLGTDQPNPEFRLRLEPRYGSTHQPTLVHASVRRLYDLISAPPPAA